MSNCDHNCSSCKSKTCAERKIQKAPLHEGSSVKKVIGIVSGKGGVGKSLVTSLLATATNKAGYTTAILDADITGPSIPKVFGISEKAKGNENIIYPEVSKTGVQIMSANLILENDSDPVVVRGPIIANFVKQFWSDVYWQDVDYMFLTVGKSNFKACNLYKSIGYEIKGEKTEFDIDWYCQEKKL